MRGWRCEREGRAEIFGEKTQALWLLVRRRSTYIGEDKDDVVPSIEFHQCQSDPGASGHGQGVCDHEDEHHSLQAMFEASHGVAVLERWILNSADGNEVVRL